MQLLVCNLHCITAIHKSLKCLEIITAKSEADDRVDSTVCVNHVIGDNVEQIKTTGKRDGTVRCTKINYHRATEIGYPENEKHYNDGCGHLKHVSVSSGALFFSVG